MSCHRTRKGFSFGKESPCCNLFPSSSSCVQGAQSLRPSTHASFVMLQAAGLPPTVSLAPFSWPSYPLCWQDVPWLPTTFPFHLHPCPQDQAAPASPQGPDRFLRVVDVGDLLRGHSLLPFVARRRGASRSVQGIGQPSCRR